MLHSKQLLFAACFGLCSAASNFVIVARGPNNTFRFEDVYQVQINGKEYVRLLSPPSDTADPKLTGKLAQHKISASILRVGDVGLPAIPAETGAWTRALPDNSGIKTPQPVAQVWSRAAITYRKDKNQKTWDSLPAGDFFALLPGTDPPEAIAAFLTPFTNFGWPGRAAEDVFWERNHLLVAAVKSFPASPAANRYDKQILTSMRRSLDRWDAGAEELSVLLRGLDYAKVSTLAFPENKEHERIRTALGNRKRAVDRSAAILSALTAGSQWDPFLTKYVAFEPYQQSYPALQTARTEAYRKSATQHLQAAAKLLQQGDYRTAFLEATEAKRRNPTEVSIDRLLEELKLRGSRSQAEKFVAGRGKIDTLAPNQVQLRRSLQMAELFIQDKKKTEAIAELKQAESYDPDAPAILLIRARLAASDRELRSAIGLLDTYFQRVATPEEFAAGDSVRTTLIYALREEQARLYKELEAADKQKRFVEVFKIASQGLRLDPADPLFLFHAGTTAAVLKRPQEAGAMLSRYLEVSDSLTGDAGMRRKALQVTARLPEQGKPLSLPNNITKKSWFSAGQLEDNLFYDPISLAFQPKPTAIKASRKLTVNYSWRGDRLESVISNYEDSHTASNIFSAVLATGLGATGQVATMTTRGADRETNQFFFNYHDDFPQVWQVTRDRKSIRGGTTTMLLDAPTQTASGATVAGQVQSVRDEDKEWKNSSEGYLVLWNSPRFDTETAAIVTGSPVTSGFSGNAYFHPFAWDGIHIFEFTYDSQGRVISALQNGAGFRLFFEWDERRLKKVTGRKSGDGSVVYSRVLNYSADRLISESISGNGKPSTITYKYDKSGRLVEAECDEDASLDGRSRKVVFQ